MGENRRNGTVDLLRMIFCLVILTFHISLDNYGVDWRPLEWGGYCRFGALSVEFFFITSGYFMARSLANQRCGLKDLGNSTWAFMKKKSRDILPYHFAFNLVAFGIALFRGHSVAEILNKISCFFFLPVFGFNNGEWMLAAEWYIGYMLFAMLIIFMAYMLIEKNIFIRSIAPISALALYGYIAAYRDILISGNHMLRAFAGILLGFTAHYISGQLKEKVSTGKIHKALMGILRIYPVVIIVLFIAYVNTTIELSVQPIVVLILASGLTVTFAEEGLVSHSHILNNKFVYWLGKMSLPIYMIQNITRMAVQTILKHQSVGIVFGTEFVVTIFAGIVSYYVLQVIRRHFHREVSA